MAFRLSKAQSTRLDELSTELVNAKEELEAVQSRVVPVIEALLEELNEAKEAYKAKVADAASELEGWKDDFESEYEDKSERWQEGERGEAVREWIESLDSFASELDSYEITDSEFEAPDDPEDFGTRLLEEIATEPMG